MKYLVTGAAGFIGSSIVDALLKDKDNEVVGVDCFLDYYPRDMKLKNLEQAKVNNKFKFIECNLLTKNLVDLLLGVDVVFHQAAQAGVRASWGKDFSTYVDNNILATQCLLEAARSKPVKPTLKKIVFASSSSIYGNAISYPTLETTTPQPISPYGVSKLAAEHLMSLYSKEFGVPTVSLRYFTVYGPRQRPDMAFHKFIKAGLTGGTINIFGNGEQTRDFTYIGDIVDANLLAAKRTCNHLVYNIGGGSRIKLKEVITTIEKILGMSLSAVFENQQAGDVEHTGADTGNALTDLEYTPKTTLEDGLKAEVAWLKDNLNT